MKPIIIPVHSYVDLITNSSSELFISKTDKTVDAIVDILRELIRLEHEKEVLGGFEDPDDHFNPDARFDSYFGKIEVCEYNFNPVDCPDYAEYKATHHHSDYQDHPVYQECSNVWRESMKEKNDPSKYRNAWKKWEDLQLKTKLAVLRWAFKCNGLEFDFDPKEDRYSGNSPFWNKAEPFEHALDWDYTFKKGYILVNSNGDNSIPYEMWDDIERVLHADRRHLG